MIFGKSTKRNFVKKCKKFKLTSNKTNSNKNLIVLKKSDLDKSWIELHKQSGRNATLKVYSKRFYAPGITDYIKA